MRLADLVGHQRAVLLLRRLLTAGRLPAGLVIEGPAGVGRRTLALALAQARLCPQPVEGDACGACESCRLIGSDTHPDLVALPPDTVQASIAVEDFRDQVVARASESSLLGGARVFILPAAERLHQAQGRAANALLKVLEEPPPNTHFILTVVNAGGLLPTIRSRSQTVRLHALPIEAVERLLIQSGLAPSEARRRAALSGGSLRRTRSGAFPDPPLAEMRALLAEGLDLRRVAEVMAALPETGDEEVAGDQRRVLGLWFEALLQDLRADLRGEAAAWAIQAIGQVQALKRDLGSYVPPRLVVEGLGLGR